MSEINCHVLRAVMYNYADLFFLVRCVVVQNAIRLRTSKRDWICAVDSRDEKLDWITVLRKAIRSSL